MIIIVINGQVLTLVYRKNKLVISFRLIEFVFPPFLCVKRSSCVLTLPFVKTIGPEVQEGNSDYAGKQECHSRKGVGFS